jgi:hypothetical protein
MERGGRAGAAGRRLRVPTTKRPELHVRGLECRGSEGGCGELGNLPLLRIITMKGFRVGG